MNIATTRSATRSSLSLPNILTYARIAAVPVVVGCIYAQSIMDGPLWLRWVAVAVFIAAGVTDYLDGYYARIWNQQSAFGRMLDPIADKLLVASCLLMLAADNSIHGWTLWARSEEHTSELQSHVNLVCRLLLEKKKDTNVIGNA